MFFLGLCFFSHARIGLLVEPGQETEKLIIVPLQKGQGIAVRCVDCTCTEVRRLETDESNRDGPAS